ncbi:alpha-keto acid decarboxylase family protein [Paractinoplanes atraurantiacus]|uniref:Alpha-keto-acid decarboxylase n=1 Tax=Paractinoplanes atraurantiacus TaxID=1036182 RepID=A0A285IQ34_9ACTN|nr:thiamine pyrophosphate-binding protein [Actinoplanes atraurantiacus]SNY50108.1 indolepyruvate decarboxylase [Actinoplanes atraurantiacus]
MIDYASTVTVAAYLGERLRQAGVSHLFGVPGDFNLNLLDGLAEVPGLRWTGSPNELGAGYAADAYARTRGLAALITTYGVGELSAINAVAGSAAEDAPVLHIVGSPRTGTVAAGALVHHTLADGDFGHFHRAYAEISVTTEVLTADRAGEQIDAVIVAARRERKPAYLSVPQDLALHHIPAAPLREPLKITSDPIAVRGFSAAVRELLTRAERPVLVVGQLAARYRLGERIAGLGLPMVTQLAAKGVIDEGTPGYLGDYAGTMLDPVPAAAVDAADVVLHLGSVQTAELTGFFSARPIDDRTVWTSATVSGVGEQRFEDVLFPDAVEAVAAALGASPAATVGASPAATVGASPTASAPHSGPDDDELTQAGLWRALQEWLPEHTALIADTGTAYWGALSLRLPAGTTFVGQPIWNSIGWALPAVLGQGLAEPDRRPVLMIGDGAAQMTIQELGTIAAAGLRPVILLLNNRGYTIERALQSPQAVYNDVTPWNWRALVAGLTGPETDYHHAATPTELDKALRGAGDHPDRLAFIEVQLDAYDTPPLLRRLAERATAAAKGAS